MQLLVHDIAARMKVRATIPSSQRYNHPRRHFLLGPSNTTRNKLIIIINGACHSVPVVVFLFLANPLFHFFKLLLPPQTLRWTLHPGGSSKPRTWYRTSTRVHNMFYSDRMNRINQSIQTCLPPALKRNSFPTGTSLVLWYQVPGTCIYQVPGTVPGIYEYTYLVYRPTTRTSREKSKSSPKD
jgi:hypothetical protein